jgi:hypothetical protein
MPEGSADGESDVGGRWKELLFARVQGDGDGRVRCAARPRGGRGVNAREWRRKAAAIEAEDLTLPSGMAIKARRPGPLKLAEWGKLPLLLGMAQSGGQGTTAEQAVEIADFMRLLLVYCCIEPRISETASEDSEDEIRPRDLPEADWMFIVRWAMRIEEADTLRPFRRQRTPDVAGDNGEAVFTETIHAAGDRGPGAGASGGPGGSAESGGAAAGERG